MILRTTAVLLAALLPAQKQEPKPASAEQLVIQRLSNPDAAAADAAMIDLIRGGPPSAPVLRAALAVCKEPNFRTRAERALAICSIDAPVERGLKIGLRADRAAVQPGDVVTLTATVCNVSDAKVALYLGPSHSGNVLENGLSLQRVDAQLPGGGEQARFGAVGFCGTGAHQIVEVLPPWSSSEFAMKVEYCDSAMAHTPIPCEGPHLAIGYVYLPVDAAQKRVPLRLHYEVELPGERGLPVLEARPDWKGTLVSNAIELTLGGTVKAAAPLRR